MAPLPNPDASAVESLMTERRALFIEDEFDQLDPILRRLQRYKFASDLTDYNTAPSLLSKKRYTHIVIDQYLDGELGTDVFEELRHGTFGSDGLNTPCAFYTNLTKASILRVLPRDIGGPPPEILLKVDGLAPLYAFLGVEDDSVLDPCRARTVIQVHEVVPGKHIDVTVPGWDDSRRVRVRWHRVPDQIQRELQEGPSGLMLYTAVATLDAQRISDLRLEDFDILLRKDHSE